MPECNLYVFSLSDTVHELHLTKILLLCAGRGLGVQADHHAEHQTARYYATDEESRSMMTRGPLQERNVFQQKQVRGRKNCHELSHRQVLGKEERVPLRYDISSIKNAKWIITVDDKRYRVVDGNMVNKLGHVFAPQGFGS